MYEQGSKNRVSMPPVSAVRTTENEYTGVHADNHVLPTFEILILAYIFMTSSKNTSHALQHS